MTNTVDRLDVDEVEACDEPSVESPSASYARFSELEFAPGRVFVADDYPTREELHRELDSSGYGSEFTSALFDALPSELAEMVLQECAKYPPPEAREPRYDENRLFVWPDCWMDPRIGPVSSEEVAHNLTTVNRLRRTGVFIDRVFAGAIAFVVPATLLEEVCETYIRESEQDWKALLSNERS